MHGSDSRFTNLLSFNRRLFAHWQLYAILALPLVYLVIFRYVPMAGLLLAFKHFSIRRGILASPWVGLENFIEFFSSPSSSRIIWNTFSVSLYGLVAGFPIPIILAVFLNELRSQRYRKTVQMITYAPYFISTVVLIGIMYQVFDPRLGIVSRLLQVFGGETSNIMGDPNLFRSLYVWSGIWQSSGYAAIIYLAALTTVDPQLQEAAIVDGVTRLQRIWHVDLACIVPTVVILFLMNMGRIMNVGFEKAFLMQNALNLNNSEIINTYVYKVGLVNADFGFATAIGFFNSLVNLALILTFNAIAKRIDGTGIL